MKDQASSDALNEYKRSGKQRSDAAHVLQAFVDTAEAMTARQVLARLNGGVLAIGLNGVRSRITELTEAGFLKKTGRVIDIAARVRVNAWAYTGQTGPLPKETIWVSCDKCFGRGKHRREVPLNPAQGRLEFVE